MATLLSQAWGRRDTRVTALAVGIQQAWVSPWSPAGVRRWESWWHGHVACPRSSRQPATSHTRHAPRPPCPQPRGPSRTWRSVIQKRTLGSMRAVAPPHPERRAAPAFLPFPAPLPGTLAMVGEAAAARPPAEAEPGGVPAPARARPAPNTPACARAALCHHAPAPRAPSVRCFRSRVPACALLGVTTCKRRGSPTPGVPVLGPGAPASRCHHLPAPPGPTPLPPRPHAPRTHCSCDSNSPIAQVISILLHPSE